MLDAVLLTLGDHPGGYFRPVCWKGQNTEGNSMAKKQSKQEPREVPLDEPSDAKIRRLLDYQMLTEEGEAY